MSTRSDKVTFIIGMALAVSAATAAPRCDWAGRVGGRSIWLSTEGLGTATELPVLWGGSSPVPSALTRSADGRVTLTKSYSNADHPDWAWTRTLSFVPSAGDSMECVFFETRANRPGKDVTATGTVSRLPPLPARPDLAAVRYGEPIDILKDGLDGFDVLDNGRASQWRFADGILENGGSGANIRTKRGDFMDFKIGYDVADRVVFGSDCGANNYAVEWPVDWQKTDDALYAEFGRDVVDPDSVYRRGLQNFLFGGGAAKRCPTPDGTEDGQ